MINRGKSPHLRPPSVAESQAPEAPEAPEAAAGAAKNKKKRGRWHRVSYKWDLLRFRGGLMEV